MEISLRRFLREPRARPEPGCGVFTVEMQGLWTKG